MNYCRTCKYWGVRAHMIGLGACCNAEMTTKVIVPANSLLYTAQDFGCVMHEEGESSLAIESDQEIKDVRREFLSRILGDSKNL